MKTLNIKFLLIGSLFLCFSCHKDLTLENEVIQSSTAGKIVDFENSNISFWDFKINGQDYSLALSSPGSYGLQIVLCNNGIYGIDDFRVQVYRGRYLIYDRYVSAFTDPCEIHFITRGIYPNSDYVAKIVLPRNHSDFRIDNNLATLHLP